MCRFKTRVAASLARCRIKNNLISIDYFLPENLKEMDRRSRRLPLYAWVNSLKTRLSSILTHAYTQHLSMHTHLCKNQLLTASVGKRKACVCVSSTRGPLTLGFCPVFYDPDVQLTFN